MRRRRFEILSGKNWPPKVTAGFLLITFSFLQLAEANLFSYAPYGPSQETASQHTFESRFDLTGNQSLLIARDENGARTQRRFNAEGRVVEEKEELLLLWEERADLYKTYADSSSLRSWAENTGSKDSAAVPEGGSGAVPAGGASLARRLGDYSPYSIGGSSPAQPLTTFTTSLYDPSGYLKESRESLIRLEGSEARKNLTRFDQDGNDIYEENTQGTFTFTLFKDREGRVLRRTGNGEEWLAVDVANAEKGTGILPVPFSPASPAGRQILRNFLLSQGRLPSQQEFDSEMKFVTDKGRFASRARLSLTGTVLAGTGLI